VRSEAEGDVTWAGAVPSLMQFSATLLPDGTPALTQTPGSSPAARTVPSGTVFPGDAAPAGGGSEVPGGSAASPGGGGGGVASHGNGSALARGGRVSVGGGAIMMASGSDDVAAALSAVAGERLSLVEHEPSNPFAAVHILSSASLRSLANALPETRIEAARFRPNIVIDADEPGFPEHAWIGRTLKAGGAMLRVTEGCIRCIMTNQATLTASLDRRVLEWVARNLRNVFGVYAAVEIPGPIAVGDEVSLVD
jgi:hypothetical protein